LLNQTGYYFQLIKDRALTSTKHKHDFFEMFFILNGQATQYLDGKRIVIHAFEFMFLSPENVHYFEESSDDIFVLSLSITADRFTKLLSAIALEPVYGQIYKSKNKHITKEILRIPTVLGAEQSLFMNAIMTDLFAEIIRSNQPFGDTAPHTLLSAIEKFREPENIGGGVERLAKLAGYSRMHLSRLIKKHYGKTPIDFICDIRMRLAIEYLEKTSYTIAVIAERVGFTSLSQFHSVFKRYFHCTPNAYRKQHTIPQLVVRT